MSDRNLRHKTVPVYDDDDEVQDEIDGKRTFDVNEKLVSPRYNAEFLIDLEGHELTFQRIQEFGLSDPIRIKKKDGLGLVVPEKQNFSVSDVRAFVGGRRIVDVMDCKTQRALEMSMREFEQYFEGKDRKHTYNVISLEFSQSRLESLVQRPKVVDCLDWIDLMWPQHLKNIQTDQTNKLESMKYPKVQKYCLMSVAGCYTDFHIDFGGTSVWYHILKGGKVFWLIPPTNDNLNLYERWTMSGNQGDVFFGDVVSKCQRVELESGNSLMIPSGWIHAVYTPHDSIVFGGNFLNSFNIPMQLRISQLEERLKVPSRFRFPFFSEVLWYVLERYIHTLTNKSHLSEEFQLKNMLQNNKVETSSDDKENDCSNEHVHLTPFEYKGLQKLLETLEFLPANNRSVPDGITDPDQLLEAGKNLLWEHSADDYQLAITGKPKAFWPLPIKPPLLASKVRKPKIVKTPGVAVLKKSSTGRIRRVRCKQCEACLSEDCMECVFCKDMRKYGGPGTMKQTCIKRRCVNPIMPSSAREDAPGMSATNSAQDSMKKISQKVKRQHSSSDNETPEKMARVEARESLPESNLLDDIDDSPPPRPSLPAVVISRVSTGDLMKYAIRPATVNIDNCCPNNSEKKPSETHDKKTIWMNVFKYLDQRNLCNCMLVSKDFLRWCGSPIFWENIDLTKKHVDPVTLQCLVRRSPVSLNLSETNISFKQLLWLLERSPSLRKLYLVGASWACVTALKSASCPPLQLLDLSWTAGFTDPHLKDLLSTPTDARPGQEISCTRLKFCHDLSLAGTEITDAGLKLLNNHLPHLKTINVSFCSITDDGIRHLVNHTSSKPHVLSTVIAQHCQKLSDNVFTHATKLPCITELDFRGCSNVSAASCIDFVKKSNGRLKLREPLNVVADKL